MLDDLSAFIDFPQAGSIAGAAQHGNYQDGEGKLVPHTEDCYACHADDAAVDTTFVQFYPTLLS